MEERAADVGALHALEPEEPVRRAAWVLTPTRPALVLGSAQRDDVVRLDRLRERGIDLVRRRTGGSAVLLHPGEVAWVDLVLPRTDPLVDPDVGRSFAWVGSLWAAALADLGIATTVHAGPMVRTAWSPLVCFAGIGAGEVLVEGRKVVGMSQRRTRGWVRIQCVAFRSSPTDDLRSLLRPGDVVAGSDDGLSTASGALGDRLDAVVDRLVHHLPA